MHFLYLLIKLRRVCNALTSPIDSDKDLGSAMTIPSRFRYLFETISYIYEGWSITSST